MQRISKFKKVSLKQFTEDSRKLFYDYSDEEIKKIYDSITLPHRSTSGSAGYDFHTPYDIMLHPHDKIIIPSGIRCKMNEEYMMLGVVRSSIGIKSDLNLCNTCMVLDSDYYYADNEGHIMIALRNMRDHMVRCATGDRIMQGIFLPFGITLDDNAEAKRTGGIGSTNA